MAAADRTPLLAAGREARWARINEEEVEQEAIWARSLSPEERLTVGQKLSQQAVSLLAASIEAGHAPKRSYWS